MLLLVQAQFQNIFGFGFADKIGEILSEFGGGFFPVFTVFFLAFFDFFAVFKRFSYFPCRFNMDTGRGAVTPNHAVNDFSGLR
ncbi:Uncharacterised protein [Mycobacteroides abscessus subsp. massiliense]|nr:Uncharacterised protein [Mycobacteroides abscessus subsp. massiliense]